jgi:hypothetical protein
MLIDKSYFKGDISLPVNKRSDVRQVGVGALIQSIGESALADYIVKFETEYLSLLLGETLYENFMAGLAAESPLQIWIDMKEALTHESTTRLSPIAYYVYCFLTEGEQTVTTIKGEKEVKADRTVSVSPVKKVVNAWHWMVRYSARFYGWLYEHWDSYREYAGDGRMRMYRFGIRNEFGI